MEHRALTAVALAACTALAACGRREESAAGGGSAAAGSAAGSAAAGSGAAALLRPLAELRERATLVEGTRRIALWIGEGGWYEPDASGLAAQPVLGAAIARARGELGGLTDVFLGAQPVLAGGEEHRERFLRLLPAPQPIALHGLLVQVAAPAPPAPAVEVWRYEHELRTELAVVDAAGAVAELAPLPRIGPDIEARSPVSAKACAAPKVRDLAGAAGAVLALVTECHPRAPVRIAAYRWAAAGGPPSREVTALGALDDLELQIDRLLAARDGAAILIGRRGDTAIALRIALGGKPAGASTAIASAAIAPTVIAQGPAAIEAVTHAAISDDGAVWIRAIGRGAQGRDRIELARNGAPVPLASPTGAPLRAEALAVDAQLGIVVLATEGASRWLLAERPPTGPLLVLPAR